MPARIEIVSGAGSVDIVSGAKPPQTLIDRFCAVAKKLEDAGAVGIVSTCGFLISIQDEIAKAVTIPVMVSSLSLYRQIRRRVGPSAKIAVVTASRPDLVNLDLQPIGIDRKDIEIFGMEECSEFRDLFLLKKEHQKTEIDPTRIETALVEQVKRATEEMPDLAAIILECGNLPPYLDAIGHITPVPVYTILDAATSMWQARATPSTKAF